MKPIFTWYLDCETEEEQADSNLDFAYYACMVLAGICLLRWGMLI